MLVYLQDYTEMHGQQNIKHVKTMCTVVWCASPIAFVCIRVFVMYPLLSFPCVVVSYIFTI